MAEFEYSPSKWVPFRDTEALERVRRIRRADLERHPNPEFRIRVVPDDMVEFILVADIFQRLHRAAAGGQRLVLILPNPVPSYRKVAHLVNRFRVDCRRLRVFAMDEYADQDGHIAPESWRPSFMYALKHNFYLQIDEALRPPESQFQGPADRNLKDYGRMIADLGGADACYSGPGWTGHLAFIEPDAPEFDAPLEEWKRLGPRIVTLSPFTLAQNSLHGSFGLSGDLAAVPPRAATIGPAEVIASKYRMDMSAITVHGTATSWQRLVCRLALHGPVTPRVPTSILQTLPTDVYVAETVARDIEPDWEKGY